MSDEFHCMSGQRVVGSKPTLFELVDGFIEDDDFEGDPAFVVRWTLNQFARNDFDTFNNEMRDTALRQAPPLIGHPGWDAFFAGLADYLSQRDDLEQPSWVSDPDRHNAGDMFYPANNHRDPDAMNRWLSHDPAPWFTDRGVGIVLRALPSGKGKHVPASL